MPSSFLDHLTPDERALEADAARLSRLDHAEFLVRLGALFLLSWIAWKTGISRALADGLRGFFSGTRAWPMTHICLVAFCVFAYEIALFPLAALREILDPPEPSPDDDDSPPGWAADWVKSILLDTVFSTAIATALYALMWFFPTHWWLAATAIYAVFVVGLSVWGPSLLLPRVSSPPRPLDDPDLLAALRRIGGDAGLDIAACSLWTPPEGARDRIVLAGAGRRRTLLIDAALADAPDASPDDLLFRAALRIAGHKNGLDLLLRAAEILIAAAVFWGMDRWMSAFSGERGIPDFFQPEVFPVWICILFGFASAGGLAMNWLNRRAVLRRDAFALSHIPSPDALLRVLLSDFRTSPFPYTLRWWQLPLSNTPSTSTRLRRTPHF